MRATPSSATRCGGSASRSRPPSSIRPDRGRVSRLTQSNSVVLPAPLGPISPQTSPRGTVRDTPASAVTPPNRTTTSVTVSAASLGITPTVGPAPIGVIVDLDQYLALNVVHLDQCHCYRRTCRGHLRHGAHRDAHRPVRAGPDPGRIAGRGGRAGRAGAGPDTGGDSGLPGAGRGVRRRRARPAVPALPYQACRAGQPAADPRGPRVRAAVRAAPGQSRHRARRLPARVPDRPAGVLGGGARARRRLAGRARGGAGARHAGHALQRHRLHPRLPGVRGVPAAPRGRRRPGAARPARPPAGRRAADVPAAAGRRPRRTG